RLNLSLIRRARPRTYSISAREKSRNCRKCRKGPFCIAFLFASDIFSLVLKRQSYLFAPFPAKRPNCLHRWASEPAICPKCQGPCGPVSPGSATMGGGGGNGDSAQVGQDFS